MTGSTDVTASHRLGPSGRTFSRGLSELLEHLGVRMRLQTGVQIAARRETVLAAPVAAKLMRRVQSPRAERLTPREIEVLTLVAVGLTNAEIGRRLYISVGTVKTHLIRMFGKLEVDDRIAPVTVAIERGFLRTPGH